MSTVSRLADTLGLPEETDPEVSGMYETLMGATVSEIVRFSEILSEKARWADSSMGGYGPDGSCGRCEQHLSETVDEFRRSVMELARLDAYLNRRLYSA